MGNALHSGGIHLIFQEHWSVFWGFLPSSFLLLKYITEFHIHNVVAFFLIDKSVTERNAVYFMNSWGPSDYCFFFPLALFEFESLLVLKIPFSVRLGFLIHLKFLISEYLSHFCSDSLFCNEMSVKKKPNSCLFFFFSCFKTCTGLVFVKHRDHGPSGGRFSKVHEFLPFQKRLENPIFLWYLLIFKHWPEFK